MIGRDVAATVVVFCSVVHAVVGYAVLDGPLVARHTFVNNKNLSRMSNSTLVLNYCFEDAFCGVTQAFTFFDLGVATCAYMRNEVRAAVALWTNAVQQLKFEEVDCNATTHLNFTYGVEYDSNNDYLGVTYSTYRSPSDTRYARIFIYGNVRQRRCFYLNSRLYSTIANMPMWSIYLIELFLTVSMFSLDAFILANIEMGKWTQTIRYTLLCLLPIPQIVIVMFLSLLYVLDYCNPADSVALHEMGHFFGLAHSTVFPSIMQPDIYTWQRPCLYNDDLRGLQYLYGSLFRNASLTVDQDSLCMPNNIPLSFLSLVLISTTLGMALTFLLSILHRWLVHIAVRQYAGRQHKIFRIS